jgi:hypothetical protein
LNYHYAVQPHNAHGPHIPWLNDQQREQFLSENLVEEIEDDSAESSSPGDDSDAVKSCLAALETLGIQADAGAPTARVALRDRGFRFSNAAVAAAVRARKANANVSGTPTKTDH